MYIYLDYVDTLQKFLPMRFIQDGGLELIALRI